MSESNGKRPSMKLSSLFITFPDSLSFSDNSKSPKSPLDIKKSPRNFVEGGGVGLGILAAMNEASDTHAAIPTRTAKTVLSPRSIPIPIVSGKTATESIGPKKEESESYTCVISHAGNESIRKYEYFERADGNYWGNSGVFYESPPKYAEAVAVVPIADFLSSCYLCRKKLQGLDIFMYRGERAFCSAECRRHQILGDEHKEKCRSEELKSLDYSCSPCSAPKIFLTGVAAA